MSQQWRGNPQETNEQFATLSYTKCTQLTIQMISIIAL